MSARKSETEASEAKIKINRAPVMTLWAAVVAERMGFNREEALTLGKAVAGLNAQSKGRRLGIYDEAKEQEKEKPEAKRRAAEPGATHPVEILGRAVPVMQTETGARALAKDEPISPQSVERYLKGKFGQNLEAVRAALVELAESFEPQDLERRAYDLYEGFRPKVPEGAKGWGALGELDLEVVRGMKKGGRG